MIIIPNKNLLVPNDEIVVPHRLAGYYKIEAVREDGSRRLLADWFPNLITTNGLDLIGSGLGLFAVCVVGTGNTTPSNSDTALQTLVGQHSSIISSNQAAQASAPYYGQSTITFRFNAGVATGNLAEVGVGQSSTSLFSRALILDGGGSPTTITVLSSEALDVTYQLRNYSPASDVTGSITVQGVTYNYTVRAALANSTIWAPSSNSRGGIGSVTAFNGVIGAVTAVSPSGSSSAFDGIANASYSSGSFQRDAACTCGLTAGNLAGGITALQVLFDPQSATHLGGIQIGLDAAIPKDATKVLSMSFRHSWARFP